MKPMIRQAHGKPMVMKRCCSRRGNRIPPMLPPVVAIPVAEPRETRKKWPIAETAGVKTREVPRPPRMDKVRMKCQYSGFGVSIFAEENSRT